MLESIHKGSSTILLGVFTCSALSCSAQTANALDVSDSSTKADFNASRTDGLSKIAGATAGTVKFIVKDAVVPVISLMFDVLLKVLATLFLTPIPYILFIYICYYNCYVLHKDSKLSWFVDFVSWAPRKFLSIMDGDTENLITCEDLEEQLKSIEKSLKDGKDNYNNIMTKLGNLKSKLNVTMGSDDFGKKLRYMLATLMFSSTKESYKKSKNKIDELYKLLKEKDVIIVFCSKCSDLLNYCLSAKGESTGKVTTTTLKEFFLRQAGLPSKEDYGYILGKIKEKMADIKALISAYKYKEDKNAEKSYNGLKDLLDVVEAEKKVSEIDKLVGNMDEEEKNIMYNGRWLSECVDKIKDHYSECVKKLNGRIIVQPLSYLDKVQSYRLASGIKHFESKSKRIDDLMEKLRKCKERLKSIVENFKDFKPLKEEKIEKNYLFSILNKEIFENQFKKSEELKSLSDLSKEDEALINLVKGELEKYKVGLLGSLEFEYRNWKCNALLEYCFGEKIKLEGIVARLKCIPLGKNKNLFSQEELEVILKKIKNKKNDIEALIKEYDEGKDYREEEYKKDKNAEKNYNDLKDLLDVIKANEKIDEINNFFENNICKKAEEIMQRYNCVSDCTNEVRACYLECIEDLKKRMIEEPSGYLDKVKNSCFQKLILTLRKWNKEIKMVEVQLPEFKRTLELEVKNFKEFKLLGEGQDVSGYLKSILYGKIFSGSFKMEIGNKTLSHLLKKELSTYIDKDLYKILEDKYNTWKEEVIGNKKKHIKIKRIDKVKTKYAGVKNGKQMKVTRIYVDQL